MIRTTYTLPNLVRIKPGALSRLGLYLKRHGHRRIMFLKTSGLLPDLDQSVLDALASEKITVQTVIPVESNNFDTAQDIFRKLNGGIDAIVGVGGGKAQDIAKYIAFLARLPFYTVPTSLSNDGFCSPQSSLVMNGRRQSLAASLPFAVVVDTAVCLAAPENLWRSGVGDLVAKVTAIKDWKLAFHLNQTPVNDFAALLSDATVFQFMANPRRDLDGIRTLATALMLNCIAIEIAGSSRPASGSEHLISHALDSHSKRPRLHGLQVGMAAYIVSHLQQHETDRIAFVLDAVGFWNEIQRDPFLVDEWLEAVRRAPHIKENYFTVLSTRDCVPETEALIKTDGRLKGCFI